MSKCQWSLLQQIGKLMRIVNLGFAWRLITRLIASPGLASLSFPQVLEPFLLLIS